MAEIEGRPGVDDLVKRDPAKPEAEKIVLEPCPCGKIPEGLMIEMQERAKYGRVMGNCCTEWAVEFRNGYSEDQERTLVKAQQAWNAAPRGWPDDRDVEVVSNTPPSADTEIPAAK